MSEQAFRVLGVQKAFGSRSVMRGIDLDLGLHDVVALIGASGSGKSTVLRRSTCWNRSTTARST